MQLSHAPEHISVVFDDENLVSCAGLVPVFALAERAGLSQLVRAHLTLPSGPGSNAPAKVTSVVGGMLAGADNIDDLGVLRHGAMPALFDGVRAPSTLGTFLRSFTFGHVRQLDAVASRLLIGLAGAHRAFPVAGPRSVPALLPGVDRVCWLDVDDTVKQTYGYAKQGAGFGYTGVKGINALVVTASTPLCRPVILASRLRKGSTNSARGAANLIASAVKTARACGAGAPDPSPAALARDGRGLVVVRADSAFATHNVIAAIGRSGARFSITARMNPQVSKAIAAIPDDAWTPIKYVDAVYDQEERRWVSDAELAETTIVLFTSRPKADRVTCRLVVRRVRRLNPTPGTNAAPQAGGGEQGELFAAYRHHAILTDSPLTTEQVDTHHRDHAVIEQVISDLKNGPLAHLPSGSFAANSAWLTMAAMTYNLTRAAATLAGPRLARATSATLRARIVNVPARIASSARRLTMHMPDRWPWKGPWELLAERTMRPPPRPATP